MHKESLIVALRPAIPTCLWELAAEEEGSDGDVGRSVPCPEEISDAEP
jgi:hypothetical protein